MSERVRHHSVKGYIPIRSDTYEAMRAELVTEAIRKTGIRRILTRGQARYLKRRARGES